MARLEVRERWSGVWETSSYETEELVELENAKMVNLDFIIKAVKG